MLSRGIRGINLSRYAPTSARFHWQSKKALETWTKSYSARSSEEWHLFCAKADAETSYSSISWHQKTRPEYRAQKQEDALRGSLANYQQHALKEVTIKGKKRIIHLGYFDDDVEGAMRYDWAIKFGFKKLNFADDTAAEINRILMSFEDNEHYNYNYNR